MLFNSVQFVVFLPFVVLLYFSIKPRFRWILLLGASYYFYMCWKPEYLILIIISTLVDYYAAIRMGKAEKKSKKKKYLILSLFSNLGLLFGFKYFNFFNDSVREVFNLFNLMYDVPALKVLLPVGISFYTFQTLSYTIDVYRGERDVEKHLGIFALYVSFFPQLVAGPIERSTHLLPQFKKHNHFNYDNAVEGLKQILWGYFKKVVVADRAAIYVDAVFNNQEYHSGITFLLATFFFAFQIYCDFSGYSDIAIGSARMMGYNLMENFKRPYFAKSIREFWQRWHISLSTWFRDYLYISLGGSRVVRWRWYYNLFITFLISGLWHGANWTFLIWGGLNGFYLIFSIWTKKLRAQFLGITRINKLPVLSQFIKLFTTFILTLIAWIFFRANSIHDAVSILSKIARLSGPLYTGDMQFVVYALFGISLLLLIEIKREYFNDKFTLFYHKSYFIRTASYVTIIVMIILFGVFDGGQFIYFQF